MGARSRIFTPSVSGTYLPDDLLPGVRIQGHRPRKRFSQSFLRDQRIADAIVRAARLTESETVVEIGPGLGVLTQRLVTQAQKVIAVEIDRDLAARLPETITSDKLELLQMDALEFDPSTIGLSEYTLVANLPYHITSPILFRFLHEVTRPRLAVLMMQREVAERISASTGQLSYLAVAVQSVATVEIVRQVPPTAFVPRPKVESTVIRLTPRPNTVATPELLTFVRAGFTQPRKRLGNSLAQGLNLPKSLVDDFLAGQGVTPDTRAHEIEIPQWQELSDAWTSLRRP